MLLRNFSVATAHGVATVTGEAVWEDSDRAAFEIRYEVPAAFAPLVAPNPDAFLVAALFPARRAGERRVRVEGEVCPMLVRGLETAMHWHRHWYGAACPVVPIEGRLRPRRHGKSGGAGALLFLSGGVDSLHTLRRNRLDVPAGHPAAITHGLLVEGFDMRRGNTYARSLAATRVIAADAGIALIAVRTNVRDLDLDDDFWELEFHGAAIASVAHVFAPSFDLAYVASSGDIATLRPWGSHPWVDPLLASDDVGIRYDSMEVTRVDKVRLLAGWPAALDNLHVCNKHPQDALNCGCCEKCLRTMLELLAVGALEHAGAFACRDIAPSALDALQLRSDVQRKQFAETIPDLARRGRADLVAAVEGVVARFRRWDAWKRERDWKGRIKRFDRRWLGGVLARIAAAR